LFDTARWPAFDQSKAAEDSVEIAVQVNGKLRARLVVGVDADEATVKAQAMKLENVARHIDGKTVRKQIYVAGKLLNVVVG
jgi:leucyl-tRNA synthetase